MATYNVMQCDNAAIIIGYITKRFPGKIQHIPICTKITATIGHHGTPLFLLSYSTERTL